VRRPLILCLVAAACADDVKPGSTIERTRILGLGAQVAADPERAWPRPGEETTLFWLVEAPAALPRLSWRAAICADDIATCASAPLMVAEGEGMPELRFVAPDAERLFVVAELTPDGEPPEALTFQLPVEREAGGNRHPHAGALRFGDAPWGEGDCPEVVAGGADVELHVATSGADRERYVDAEGADDRESLRLSFFTTAGELEGQFRVVEPDDPEEADSHLAWTPPAREDVPDGGLEVRFTVVVRDLRGGIAFTTRTACVRP
jgi:hypothetical protein